jgi:RNA-binding protein YhbY
MVRQIKKLQMGKNGLSEEFVEQVKKIFEKESILKISLLRSATRNKMEAEKIANDLIDKLGKNYVYRLIGYVLVINKFRRNVRE